MLVSLVFHHNLLFSYRILRSNQLIPLHRAEKFNLFWQMLTALIYNCANVRLMALASWYSFSWNNERCKAQSFIEKLITRLVNKNVRSISSSSINTCGESSTACHLPRRVCNQIYPQHLHSISRYTYGPLALQLCSSLFVLLMLSVCLFF